MLLVPESLVRKLTTASRAAFENEEAEIDWSSYVFTAWAKCSDPSCENDMVISGTGEIKVTKYHGRSGYEPQRPEEWEEQFAPECCIPMPDIIGLPKKCPVAVASELRAAFKLFWSDPSAAANRTRVAVERLMDHLRIQKRGRTKQGKKWDLHNRIGEFTETARLESWRELGKQLMAIKWLGNKGSHERTVPKDDVLTAFEIIQNALFEIIDHRSSRLVFLARGLTAKHAPPARKKAKQASGEKH